MTTIFQALCIVKRAIFEYEALTIEQYNPVGNSFFLVFFVGHIHMSLFWGSLVLTLWISGDVSSGFQSQSGFCLIRIAEANVMYIQERNQMRVKSFLL